MAKNQISVMSYQDWKELDAEVKRYKKLNYKKQNRRMSLYFRRQRLMGFAIMIIGLIVVSIGCVNQWKELKLIGTIITFFGMYCIFTKRMIYIDTYYLECQDRLRNII